MIGDERLAPKAPESAGQLGPESSQTPPLDLTNLTAPACGEAAFVAVRFTLRKGGLLATDVASARLSGGALFDGRAARGVGA